MNGVSKRLDALLDGVSVVGRKGDSNPSILRLAIDSRRVSSGSLFFALPGLRSDGAAFIDEAVARGAVAVISNEKRRFGAQKVDFITVEEARLALAQVAGNFFDHPDQDLELIGITGTNGKSTVALAAQALLSGPESKVGCIGTIGYDLVGRSLPSFRTTPEAHDLQELLSQMRTFDCKRATLEVSSHGIDQNRVSEMRFAVAAFLNLTRDHLDYHGDMESYYKVKRRLFDGSLGRRPAHCVINLDDAYGARLFEELEDQEGLLAFGTRPDAHIRATEIELKPEGSRFKLHWPGGSDRVSIPLIGDYNVSNAMAALSVCYALGEDMTACIERAATLASIPGRMERVPCSLGFQVVVDYAHTEDALRNALEMLSKITPGNVLLVFGCGGNRDRGKRPNMTHVAIAYANKIWATADNPRKEPIERIFEDMKQAVAPADPVEFVTDRRRAIELALKAARPGDCVLIAGKGHESFQEFGETVVPFDDRKVAAELLHLQMLGGQATG